MCNQMKYMSLLKRCNTPTIPIHLNEIKLTMEFWEKIADVAPGGNVFFEMGLLSAKIRLSEVKAPLQQQLEALCSHLEPSHCASSPEFGWRQRSQSKISLEPAGHMWVVLREIQILMVGCISGELYATNVVFRILDPSLWWLQLSFGNLGIFRAERASGARFWWLGALSNRKRPVANPLVFVSKMSIACETCLIRSSDEK